MLVEFEGVRRPVFFAHAAPVHDHLSTILNGWPLREVATAPDEPVITVEHHKEAYRLWAPWFDEAIYEPSAVSAACSVVVDLVRAYITDNPQLLCLHCGAVEIGGQLVVFPSTNRAGKSTLVTRLAAAGYPVFADDLLPILDQDDLGMSLGIAPRLRLPLPDHATAEFRRFTEEHVGPDDGYYRYVLPGGLAWPRHGTRAPLGAVVLLDRQPGSAARIAAAPKGYGLQHLIVQNVARAGGALAIVDRLHALLSDMPCLTLTYCDLEEAVALLERTFADWTSDVLRETEAAACPPTIVPATQHITGTGSDAPPVDGQRFARHPDVRLRSVDGELFLVDPAGTAIFHVNAMGTGVWNLLDVPASPGEVVEALAIAFPDLERTTVECDVAALFAALEAGGLIRRSEV